MKAWLAAVGSWLFLFACDHLNHFSVPAYETSVSRDLAVQLTLSAVAIASSITLVSTALVSLSAQPIITPVTDTNPSPDEVLELFRRRDAEQIQGLSCPCSTQAEVLSAVSNWTVVEDSYCAVLRSAVADPEGSGLNRLLRAPENEVCIGGQSDPEYRRFLTNVQDLSEAGSFWSGTSDRSTDLALNFLQEAICGFAFGLIPPSRYYPLGSPAGATTMANWCSTVQFQEEEIRLAPPVFAYSTAPINVMQSQHSRALSFFAESAGLCQTLAAMRNGFLRDVQQVRITAPLALSPGDLGAAVEAAFFSKLDSVGASTAAFVPGLTPDGGLAAATDAFNPLFELAFPPPRFTGTQDRFPDAIRPPQLYTATDFSFSSRLPFVRSDYIEGGTRHFYMIADLLGAAGAAGDSELLPAAAGLARLRVATNDTGVFPLSATTDPFRVTPGFDPNVTQGWAPVGDDLLTLLDACATGAQLTVDVHNFRKVQMQPGFDQSEAPWGSPLNVMNLDNTCSLGAPPQPPNGVQPVLFNVSVRCPPLLVWLGGLRRNSSFFARGSSSRMPIREFFSASPDAQAALIAALRAGDALERLDLLRTLSIDEATPKFTHSPLRHYAACAPAFCTYTVIEQRTAPLLALEAISIYGGTATTVVTVLGLLATFLAALGRRWDAAMEGKQLAPPLPSSAWQAPPTIATWGASLARPPGAVVDNPARVQ
jgi:hypothetical protein